MIRLALLLLLAGTACFVSDRTDPQHPVPKSPIIPEADGYVAIAGAAVPPQGSVTYRAIFDATRAADKPTQILPALNMAGSELNALGVSDIPLANAKFVIAVHGAAVDGLLDDEHYKARFGVGNPNLAVITGLKKAGVQIYVCGQQRSGAPDLFLELGARHTAQEVIVPLLESDARTLGCALGRGGSDQQRLV